MFFDLLTVVIILLVGITIGILTDMYFIDVYICKRRNCSYRTYEEED